MRLLIRAGGCAVAFLLFLPCATAFAQTGTFISGEVVAGGKPVSAAVIDVAGNNLVLHATSDQRGQFAIYGLPVGTYQVSARAPQGSGAVQVDLSSGGAHVSIELLKTIGSVNAVRPVPVKGSGTDLTLNALALSRAPSQGSLSEILVQLPGAARGANGVVHINGDHGDINYIVDGVSIPQELNRNIGTEFDPADISYAEVLQGAYPAQFGERFASVININTKVGTGTRGLSGYTFGGAFAHYDSSLGYHTNVGSGSLVFNVRGERNERSLDPPNFDSPHNTGSNVNEFVRFTQPLGNDYWNVTLSNAYRTFQIPIDVLNGGPAATDDNETQQDLFATFNYHHLLKSGALTYDLSFKRSRIRDFGDPSNDFAFGQALNIDGGGAPDDCANGTQSACGFSLFADRTAFDYRFTIDDDVRSAKHEVRVGGFYDRTRINKLYAVTLQPGNFLAPILTPAMPDGATTVTDNAPNNGNTEAVYIQDSWKLGEAYQLDYGLRADSFRLSSTEFDSGFGQISPRVKLTRLFGQRGSLYVYYGRFFTPFSFENVSPAAAQLLNLPNQPTLAQFDLRPQRDSVYEIGGHLPVGAGNLGFRIAQRNATDLIDDTQVGTTNLHQDINYAQGRIATQSLYFERPLLRQSRVYASVTHTYSVNKGCETQLLAPCFGAPDDWTPADHDQRWDINGGLILNDLRGGWFSVDGEYGSGLSSASCQPDSSACKVPPHTTFDLEKGFGLGNGTALTLRVRNMFNDRYWITYQNAQGNHWSIPREIELGIQFGAHS
jgi:hypothetical protein